MFILSRLTNWIVDHLAIALGSVLGIYASLISLIFILALPTIDKLLFLAITNWIQLWALFIIQRTENKDRQEQQEIRKMIEDIHKAVSE